MFFLIINFLPFPRKCILYFINEGRGPSKIMSLQFVFGINDSAYILMAPPCFLPHQEGTCGCWPSRVSPKQTLEPTYARSTPTLLCRRSSGSMVGAAGTSGGSTFSNFNSILLNCGGPQKIIWGLKGSTSQKWLGTPTD